MRSMLSEPRPAIIAGTCLIGTCSGTCRSPAQLEHDRMPWRIGRRGRAQLAGRGRRWLHLAAARNVRRQFELAHAARDVVLLMLISLVLAQFLPGLRRPERPIDLIYLATNIVGAYFGNFRIFAQCFQRLFCRSSSCAGDFEDRRGRPSMMLE